VSFIKTTSVARISAVLSMALFFWATATVVDSLAVSQILVPLAWAESERLEGQEGVVKNKRENVPAEASKDGTVEKEVAQSQETPAEELEDEEEVEEEIEENVADKVHGALSGAVSSVAGKVDAFFDDKRYAEEVNTSRIKLRVDYFLEKGEDPELKLRFNLSLALPKINKRLKLLVSGKPDEEETDETGAGFEDEGEDDNVDVAVAYSPVDTTEHKLSMRAGLRFKSITPAFYVGPRWRAYSKGEIWGTRLTNFFRWYTDTGFRIDTTLDFERPVTKNIFYRQSIKGKWDQDNPRYDYQVILALFQKLARRKGLKYEYINKFRSTNDNYQLDNIIFKVTYRQSFWRKWLFFEIAPQVSFPESEGWDFTPGILFRIETIIGKERLKKKKKKQEKK